MINNHNRNWTRPRAFRPDTALGYRHERVGSDDCPYLERWLINFGPFAIRLHHFFRSDEEHLHDHPWWFVTLVLKGSYLNMVECPSCGLAEPDQFCENCQGQGQVVGQAMHPGTVAYRASQHRHRVLTQGCWTLLVTGRKSRDWGFWVNNEWMRQRKYFRKYGSSIDCD